MWPSCLSLTCGRALLSRRRGINVRSGSKAILLYDLGMACPSCSGTQGEPIALGYWRCTSRIAHSTVTMVPIFPGDPRAGMRPLEQVSYSICGFAYQEGDGRVSAAAPLCKCGMFAIGACSQCGVFTCGVHGRLMGEQFLCGEHARQEQQRREASERDAAKESDTEAPKLQCYGDTTTSTVARLRAQYAAERREAESWRQAAEKRYRELVDLIREVMAMPGAKSVTYQIQGKGRNHKWGTAHAPDPSRLGTHVADRLSEGPAYTESAGPRPPRFVPISTYTGVWPAMAWLSGWTPERPASSPEPIISVLWFNRSGMLASGGLTAPSPGHSSAIPDTAMPLDSLTMDHVAAIYSSIKASLEQHPAGYVPSGPLHVPGGPTLLRQRITQIVSGNESGADWTLEDYKAT